MRPKGVDLINMADTNASLDYTIKYVNNPKLLLNSNPEKFSEQPDMSGFVPKKNGTYDYLKGVENINAHVQIALKMIAGKGNNLTDVFGEDVQENTYAAKIAGVAARLDSQLNEEQERTGIRGEKLNWSYTTKDGNYKTTDQIGVTDERVHSKDIEEMPVEEKADTVTSVQCFNGEMDVAGGRNHYHFNHWLCGESVEVREEKMVFINRPIMPLAAPVHKGFGKFPIASIKGYEEDFEPFGKIIRMPIFGLFNMTTFNISVSGRGHMEHSGRSVKMTGDIETLKAVLTSEPQFASEIAKKTGFKPVQVSKILKAAFNAGEKIVIGQKKDASRRMVPVFSL